MSRQTERQFARAVAKADFSRAKLEARKVAKRALLERQSAREKNDGYTGRSVAAAMAESRSRVSSRKVRKGDAFGRIIKTVTEGGRENSLHATKGWRSHRAA